MLRGVAGLNPVIRLLGGTEKEALKQFQTGWRSHLSNKMRAETSISLHHSPTPRADVPGHT